MNAFRLSFHSSLYIVPWLAAPVFNNIIGVSRIIILSVRYAGQALPDRDCTYNVIGTLLFPEIAVGVKFNGPAVGPSKMFPWMFQE